MTAPPSTCAECRLLLGGYVLDALDPDEATLVERHLAGCQDCARERDDLAGLPMLLDFAGAAESTVAEPPATLEEAVLDRFAREQRERRPAVREYLRRRFARVTRPLPAATAAALAACVVALVVVLASGGGRADTYTAHLTGVAGARADARLITFAQGTHVRLDAAGLGTDPSAIYELWCVRDDGAKVSAGTFRPDGHGHADVTLTTAAVPTEYHHLSVERLRSDGWTGRRVLAGTIRYQ